MFKKIILTLLALSMIGCGSVGYNAQRIEIARHTLVLHETRVDMENAHVKWWSGRSNWRDMPERGTYTGWFDPLKNDLHCVAGMSRGCMAHEYEHLAEKHGLQSPDPHFQRKNKPLRITEFTLTGH